MNSRRRSSHPVGYSKSASRNRIRGWDYCQLESRQMLSANSPSDNFESLAADLVNLLKANPETVELTADQHGLNVITQQPTGNGTTWLVQQTNHGIPVYNAWLTVTQDGSSLGLSGQRYLDANPSFPIDVAVGSRLAAEQLALSSLGQPVDESRTDLVWFDDGSTSQLVWQVTSLVQPGNHLSHGARIATLVDAQSSTVLFQETLASEAQLLLNPETRIGDFARIVINDVIGPAGSQDYADPFDAVVALPGCTGTLVATNLVLSARHCGSAAGDVIRFGDDSNAPIFTATVTDVQTPAGPGTLLDGGDLTILTLDVDVPDTVAKPMRLTDFTTELEGMVAATVGYGYNGIGSLGHQFTSDGVRWGGENIIDVYGSPAGTSGANIISTDFDDGSSAANTIVGSDPNPLTFEATTAPGDSGGPILVQLGSEWVVAGVLSGGTTSTSVYGDISWWTGVNPFRAEIEAGGGLFYTDGTVNFDQATYGIGDSLTVTVVDPYATQPVQVTVVANSGDTETLVLTKLGANYTGSITISGDLTIANDGILQVTSDATLTASYGLAATDEAVIQSVSGTDGNDVIIVTLDDGITINLNGVDLDPIVAQSASFDAKAGYDRLTIIDNAGDDTVTFDSKVVNLFGDYSFFARNVEWVSLVSGGGQDSVRMYGTDRDETLTAFGNETVFAGEGFEVRTTDYAEVFAYGRTGNDRAELGDSAANDQFNVFPVFANVRSQDRLVNVRDFESVQASSTMGGFDVANFNGTSGNEVFYANPALARFNLPLVEATAAGFDRVVAKGAGGLDRATLVGSPGNDTFNSRPFLSYLYGDGFFNQASDFDIVNATGNGGVDRALMFDSPGDDTFYGTPDYATLYSVQSRSRATGFDQVTAIGSAGFDNATFIDSTGDDRFVGRPTDAYLVGDQFLLHALTFNRVTAQSTGGFDRAALYSSVEDNRFFGSKSESYLFGATFFNSARNFRNVSAQAGSAALAIGSFVDSAGDDTFLARENKSVLYSDDYLVEAIGLDVANATSSHGGVDRLFADLAEFDVLAFGDWI